MHEIRQMECKIYIFSTQAAHCKQIKVLDVATLRRCTLRKR